MPSPTSSTRPICSACGLSGGGAELCARVLEPGVRLGRQGRLSCAQVRKDSVEIGAPAVAHDEMGAVQLEAGDKRGIRP